MNDNTRNTFTSLRVILFVALFGGVAYVGCGEQEPILIDCQGQPVESTTAMIGRTEYGLFYRLGTVVINYEEGVVDQLGWVLTDPVKRFFIQRGYKPEVRGILFDKHLIYIGDDIDTTPMLKDLNRVKGVEKADIVIVFTLSDLVLSRLYHALEVDDTEPETMPRALVKVGKTSDGSLYELGSVLVAYQNSIFDLPDPSTPFDTVSPSLVRDFFLSKGYEPQVESLHVRLQIVRLDECVDTAPMLEALRALPGVADVHLNMIGILPTSLIQELAERSRLPKSQIIE